MEKQLTRDDILAYIQQSKDRWEQEYGVIRIALFGSWAREDAKESSDIDILIDMPNPTFRKYIKFKRELESYFNRPVDLLTTGGIKERVWPYIKRDLIYA